MLLASLELILKKGETSVPWLGGLRNAGRLGYHTCFSRKLTGMTKTLSMKVQERDARTHRAPEWLCCGLIIL